MLEKFKRYIYISLSLGVLSIIITIVSCTKRVWEAPVVGEVLISSINTNSANGYLGSIADKGFELTLFGICWNTSPNPTISNNKIQSTSNELYNYIDGKLENLSPGTTYYVRGFASNKIGLSYGEESSFTTSSTTPTITTVSVTSITSNSATSGGNISSDGGAPITARGVCWSTFQNPTIYNSKTSDETGTGGFTSSITGLWPGVQYIVRAYATNSLGTSYGNNVSFTTSITLPTITTSSVTSVSSTTATSGGNITSDGGSTVTARGVCWSTSQNPTISNSKTTNGAGTGNFTSSITGLLPGTTYYVRAYATNSVGTGYGTPQHTFTTAQETEINVALSTNGASITASAIASYFGNRYAHFANDNNSDTFWAGNIMPAWLAITFGKSYLIKRIGIWWGSHKHTFSIKSSVNGIDWTEVVPTRQSNNYEDSPHTYESYSISPLYSKYIKVDISTTTAPSSHIFQAIIAEIEVYSNGESGGPGGAPLTK